jgi:PAS domain S-box-containing protein
MAEENKNEKQLRREIKKLKEAHTKLEQKVKQLEEINAELQKDKSLTDALMNALPDHIYFKDRQSRFIRVNDATAAILGKNDHSKVIGKTDFDFFTREHAQQAFKDEKEVMKSGESIVGKEELETWPDGRETWAHTTKMPLRNKQGKIVGTFGVSRDITSIKQTEQQFKALMDNIPDAIYFKDSRSCFILINKSCADKFGVGNPDDAKGKTDFDYFSPEHAQPAFDDEQEVIKTGIPIIGKEELEVKPDGTESWVNSTKMPLRNKQGKIIGTFGISRDITGMKQAERQLKTLMDNIPDAIYFKDKKSRFTLINKACAEGFSVEDPEEAYGKTDFDFFSKAHAQPAFDDEQRVIKTGKPIIGLEELESWEDGSERWVSTTKLPLKDHRGNILGTFGLSRDIDRLKRAEEQLQKTNEILEKKVQKRTAELRKANEGMKIRIQQLDYLNKKAHFFTQLIDRDTLLPVIFYAFVERFPGSEVHLCDMGPSGFRTAYSTDSLREGGNIPSCVKALQYLETDKEEGLFLETCWMKNTLLKGLFNNALEKFPCYIVIPLITDRKLRGAVQIFAPEGFKHIYEQEYMVLNTLSAQAAMSLDNANNYRQLAERTRLQSELEIAQGIQKRFTPEDPVIPNLQIKGICRPANEVGGDYLDFFQNNLGEWVFVIADVCGKGIPAALVMTSLRSIIRTEAREESSSKKLLSAVNNLMAQDLQMDNSFITCMALIIDKNGMSMNFTRAGHPMLIAYNKKDMPRTIPCKGIALGMLMGPRFNNLVEEVHLDLASGDKFLAYTDGLDEAMNSQKETYGHGRLLKLLGEGRSLNPGELVENILRDIEEFCEGQPQYDDLTLFAMEKL